MGGWKSISKLFVVHDDAAEGSPEELASPEEIERMLAEVRGETGMAPPAPAPAPKKPAAAPPPAPKAAAAPAAAPTLVEGRSFDALYADAKVPASPYPAERLLKLLDGLLAMDAPTRATVVAALDAADESWTIADALLDAERKAEALGQAKGAHADALKRAEADATSAREAQDRYLAEATDTIHKQIADLQKMLEGEVATVNTRKAEIDGGLRAAREACARETARLDGEIARLSVIPKTFTPDPKRR